MFELRSRSCLVLIPQDCLGGPRHPSHVHVTSEPVKKRTDGWSGLLITARARTRSRVRNRPIDQLRKRNFDRCVLPGVFLLHLQKVDANWWLADASPCKCRRASHILAFRSQKLLGFFSQFSVSMQTGNHLRVDAGQRVSVNDESHLDIVPWMAKGWRDTGRGGPGIGRWSWSTYLDVRAWLRRRSIAWQQKKPGVNSANDAPAYREVRSHRGTY